MPASQKIEPETQETKVPSQDADQNFGQNAERVSKLEHFIPVTRHALTERLSARTLWPQEQVKEVRRFFRYLGYWRHQQHMAALLELGQTYEPFSPDTDLLVTRAFTADERLSMQKRVFAGVSQLMKSANYKEISTEETIAIMKSGTTYGLDLHVDFDVFEHLLIAYRGEAAKSDFRRRWNRFFFKEQFDVPIYKRLCIVFKLKPLEVSIADIVTKEKLTWKEAKKIATKRRSAIPEQVTAGNIYMKLFKNIPRADLEMVFPNTQIKFRFKDKVMLIGGASTGVGASVVTAVFKIGLILASPITALITLAGFGGVLFRSAMNVINQKQRYMVVMAQNLYFHSMADNRGVMIKLADRAAEEDVKEEILLYSVLVKEKTTRRDLAQVDKAIEKYLDDTFGVKIDFEVSDALERLLREGLVTETADGTFIAMPPAEAAKHIDDKWDLFLDKLPDFAGGEGVEISGGSTGVSV